VSVIEKATIAMAGTEIWFPGILPNDLWMLEKKCVTSQGNYSRLSIIRGNGGENWRG
jgi:hypothetical protein